MLRKPEWKVVHYDLGGQPLGEASPSDLSFSLTLNEPGKIGYDLNLANPLARRSKTEAYGTDWKLIHDETVLMGGMHTAVGVDSSERIISVAGVSWLGYLEERFWPLDPTNPGASFYGVVQVDIFTILTQILDRVLAEPKSLSFTYNLGLAGVLTNYSIEIGDTETILSKISGLADQDTGFDFEDTADREFKAYAPRKENIGTYVYSQDINMSQLNYEDTGKGGDVVIGLGAGSGRRMAKKATFPSNRRRDASIDLGDVRSQSILQNRTNAERDRLSKARRAFRGTLIPEKCHDMWHTVKTGDRVRVQGDTEYEVIDEMLRITGIEVRPSDEGDIEIDITFDDGDI